MIKSYRVAPYEEALYCDSCGIEMEFTNECTPCDEYIHKCPNCGHRFITYDKYPKLVWRRQEDEI